MEAPLAESDIIPLIGELSLSLQSNPRAPYVVSRTNTESHCAQNVITHQGVNVMSFTLASSDQWLDPKSMCIAFTIHNTSDAELKFLALTCKSFAAD